MNVIAFGVGTKFLTYAAVSNEGIGSPSLIM